MAELQGSTVEEKLLLNSHREGSCLRWDGAHNDKGYGRVTVQGQLRATHREAYEIWNGPIPKGLEVDHVRARGCLHRDCIEPTHLEAVTHAENAARTTRSQCRAGHSLPPVTASDRSCLSCKAEPTPCPDCGKSITRRHLARHRRTHAASERSA